MASIDPKQCDSKIVAVEILKGSGSLDANTKSVLAAGLITGILAAEDKRLSWLERRGFDGDTVGPGQMGKPSHTDVVNTMKTELADFIAHMNTNCGAKIVQQGFPADVTNPVLAHFFIAAFLAICIKRGQKPGRSPDDALQFGIGRYHGAFETLKKAQDAVKSVTAYPPVKAHLLGSKNKEMIDLANYIEEAFSSR